MRLSEKVISSTSSITWRAVRNGWVDVSIARATKPGNQRANPAGGGSGDIGDGRNRGVAGSIRGSTIAGRFSRLGHSGRCRRAIDVSPPGSRPPPQRRSVGRCRRLPAPGTRVVPSIAAFTCWRSCGAVDFGLGLDGQAGLHELLFGPDGFGGRTHLGSLNGDRRIGHQLGTFAFGAGFCVAIMGRFASPQPQDQWQKASNAKNATVSSCSIKMRVLTRRQLLHGDPPSAKTVIRVRDRCRRSREHPLVSDDSGIQSGARRSRAATASSSSRWESARSSLAVRVSGPEPGTPVMRVCGHAGVGWYSQRATTSASSRWVRATSTAVVERDTRIAHPLRLSDACTTAGAEAALRAACSSSDGRSSRKTAPARRTHPRPHPSNPRPRPAFPRIPRSARSRRPADRAHQQREYQGERHDGQHRQRVASTRRGSSPARPMRIEEHDHAGDRMRRPLVTFVEFAALAAADPGEPRPQIEEPGDCGAVTW